MAASSANSQTLEQGRAFAWRSSLSLATILSRIGLELLLIFLILLPTDVTGVRIGDKRIPFFGRNLLFRSLYHAAR
jgi:hypothetical protein